MELALIVLAAVAVALLALLVYQVKENSKVRLRVTVLEIRVANHQEGLAEANKRISSVQDEADRAAVMAGANRDRYLELSVTVDDINACGYELGERVTELADRLGFEWKATQATARWEQKDPS